MEKVYLTKEGKQKLELELDNLIKNDQKNLINALAEARDKGDISENAEYESAKSDLETLSIKISEIQKKLSNCEIISKQKGDCINMLSSILVLNQKTMKEFNWQLVPENEVNIKEGKISFNSPIGSSFLGRKAGDVINVQVPSGEMIFKVLKVS